MKVLHLIKGLDRGGAEVLLTEVVRLMPMDRFQLSVGYFLPQRSMMVPTIEALGASVHCFHARTPAHMLAAVPVVAAKLTRWRPDIVHCHLPLAGVVGRLAARVAGIPVVYTEHNLVDRYHPITRWLNLATWRLQRRVIAVSAEVGASIRRYAPPDVPVDVVMNGIPADRFGRDPIGRSRIRMHLGIPAEAPVVGTVAVFRAAKRLDLWLEVAARVLRALPNAHFLVVGWGPLQLQVEATRARLKLEDRVHLTGPQTDVRPYLGAMDVFLLSSDFEGLPLALLEAMATGVPIVATNVGGISEVVEHGRSGWLAEPGQADQLAKWILALLRDPDTRMQFGDCGRVRVERDFSIRRLVADIERLYSLVLSQGRGA